jgi:hypothetical protein
MFHIFFSECLIASGKAQLPPFQWNLPQLNAEVVQTVLVQKTAGLRGTDVKFQFIHLTDRNWLYEDASLELCVSYVDHTILQWKCNFTAEREISIKKPKLGILAKSDAHNGIYWPCVAVWTTGVQIKHYCEKPGNQGQGAYNQRGTFSKQWKSLK